MAVIPKTNPMLAMWIDDAKKPSNQRHDSFFEFWPDCGVYRGTFVIQ
jgi:hypothetical protein